MLYNRHVPAVKAAKRYIEKHYKVNAGNYSRDNDYVGGVYIPDEQGNPENHLVKLTVLNLSTAVMLKLLRRLRKNLMV